MKKTIKTTIKIFISLCCVFIALGAVMLVSGTDMKKGYAFSDVEIKTQYMIEDILELPDGKFNIDDKEYDAEKVVYYPNGDVKKTNLLRFVDTGKYTIEYRVEVNGNLYSKTYETNAVKNLYSVSSGLSSVQYKLDDSQYNTGISGLAVELSKGNTFNFNRVIDLNELQGEDIISLFVLPKTYGKRDITDIKLYLTDAYNSSNQVVVQLNAVNSKGVQATSAWNVNAGMAFVGLNEYMMYGYRTESNGSAAYEKHSTTYRYAYESAFSFSGSTDVKDCKIENCVVGKQFFTVQLDLESGKVFVGSNGNAQRYNYGSEMAANLNDRSVFPSGWQGFTTGEVYLSIKCDGYINNSALLMINKVGNEDLTELTDNGVVSPKLSVDLGAYSQDNLPVAKVGTEYKIFNAVMSDHYNTDKVVEPRVFFNYNSPLYREIEIENGAFVPDRAGKYTIVYKVADAFGNLVQKCCIVDAKEDFEMSAKFSSGYVTVGVAGSEVNLATLELSDVSGNADVCVVAVLGNETIDVEGYKFIPEKSGEYTITYTVTDYLGQKVQLSYQLNISESDIPVMFKAGNMPKYFMEDKQYVLPEFDMRDLSVAGSSANIKATITVTDGNGTNTLADDRKYTPKADADGKTSITYSATSASGETLTLPAFVVPVVNVRNDLGIDITKYFITQGSVNEEIDSSGVTYSGDKEFSVEFIKPVLADTFILSTAVSVIGQYEITSAMYKINVVDSINSDQSIEIAIEKRVGVLMIYVNGVRYVSQIGYGKTIMNSGMVTMEYKQKTLYFNDSEIVLPISTYLNGEAFNGFTSGYVYFALQGTDVQGPNAIKISQVNNQPVRKVIRNDAVLPEIALVNDIKRTVEKGDVITLSNAYACDVLDNNTTLLLTVRNPDGTIARSKDGITLNNVAPAEYNIDVVEYGNYVAEYVAEDGNGCQYTYTVNIASVDLIPPEIIVSGEIKSTAKVGDEIKIPTPTVTDNVEGTYRTQVYICSPLNVYILYNSKNTYKFTQSGEWKIIYLAYDGNENESVKTFTIKVNK